MDADERKFAEIVRNAESFARQSPRAYRVAVFALASAGYLYICTVVVGAFAVLGAMLYGIFLGLTSSQQSPAIAANMVRFMLPLLVGVITFLATVVRSLYVVIPAPNGPRLSRETAGRLYAFLDEISAAVKAPRFDHVLLDMDLNAGVVQVPRFGLMGPQRNYLIIGFPLMKALSRDQFKAVMAHELGHISRNHSRFSGWIYRQRATWIRIFHTVEHELDRGRVDILGDAGQKTLNELEEEHSKQLLE